MTGAPNRPGQAPAKVNPNIVPGAMIVGAIITAVIGALMPNLIGLTGPEATWIPLVFYAIAALEIGIALFFRRHLIRTQQGQRPGGTIERQ